VPGSFFRLLGLLCLLSLLLPLVALRPVAFLFWLWLGLWLVTVGAFRLVVLTRPMLVLRLCGMVGTLSQHNPKQ